MNKRDYDEMLTVYKDQIGMLKETIGTLREENHRLSQQVFKLQDGLMAVRAPEAYRDYRNDMIPEVVMPEEEKAKLQQNADLMKRYLNNIEQPLFRSASDMEEILAPTLFGNVNKTESIHDNSES
jgi:regulator of replication initiation timing